MNNIAPPKLRYTTIHPKVPVKVSKPNILAIYCMLICQYYEYYGLDNEFRISPRVQKAVSPYTAPV